MKMPPKQPGVSKAKPATTPKSIPRARKEAKKARLTKKAVATKQQEAKKQAGIGKSEGQKHAGGAPTKKTKEILRAICVGISTGKSARAMAVEVGIDQSTIWAWLAEDAEFSEQYARAKEDCADFIAAECLEIADDGINDTYTKDGVELTNHDVIARSRLRVDARKWYASKLAPKKYGDRTVIAGDPSAPQELVIRPSNYDALLAKRLKKLGNATTAV